MTDSAAAFISVIVITYNEERNIRPCLESLRALDYPPERREIIIVDASTDSTPEIVAAYPDVRLVWSAKGFAAQKNAGVAAARADLLAFSDADCLFPPDWLKSVDRAFLDPRLDVAGGNAFPPPGVSRFELWSACVGHPAGGAMGFEANVASGPGAAAFAPGCNSVYRRRAIEAVGGFSADFNDGAEDVDISRRMKAAGFRIDYIPDLTVYHWPRPTLKAYLRWNVGVGITKFNLGRPGFFRIVANPFFPVWPVLILAALSLFPGFPALPLGFLLVTAVLFPPFLLLAAKPYRRLWRQRRKIGISVGTTLCVVPLLTALRQAAISCGELKKWRSLRRSAGRSPSA